MRICRWCKHPLTLRDLTCPGCVRCQDCGANVVKFKGEHFADCTVREGTQVRLG